MKCRFGQLLILFYLHPYGDANGGDIKIADPKKGTFTAAASRHGESVQQFASQVLANKDNGSPTMIKKASFTKNAAYWHGEEGEDENDMICSTGGPMDSFSFNRNIPAVRH